jgi:hypothetical protein
MEVLSRVNSWCLWTRLPGGQQQPYLLPGVRHLQASVLVRLTDVSIAFGWLLAT